MKPVALSCEVTLPQQPGEIALQILDLRRWPEFTGYGPLPGIREAAFETSTAEIVGTRIRVTNRDGSAHVEEIVEWDLPRRLRLRMHEFSPPVAWLATCFTETWDFKRDGERTKVRRSFELYPTSALARPALRLISLLLKRAIARHLEQMRRAVATD